MNSFCFAANSTDILILASDTLPLYYYLLMWIKLIMSAIYISLSFLMSAALQTYFSIGTESRSLPISCVPGVFLKRMLLQCQLDVAVVITVGKSVSLGTKSCVERSRERARLHRLSDSQPCWI